MIGLIPTTLMFNFKKMCRFSSLPEQNVQRIAEGSLAVDSVLVKVNKRSVLRWQSKRYKSKYKKVGVLPIYG